MNTLDTLEFILDGAETKRWHTVPTIAEQKVDAHSFHVAWFCYMLTGGKPRAELLLAALAHDLPERKCGGDLAAPAKRALGAEFRAKWEAMEDAELAKVGLLFELSEVEARILKLADVYEYALYAIRERRLGNQNFGTVMQRILGYLYEMETKNETEEFFLDYIQAKWNEARRSAYHGV